MNCSFCARDGVANAEAPNSAASAIPIRFLFIGSSIDTRKRLGAARGSRISPLGWRKVQRPPTARLRFAAARHTAGRGAGRERTGGPNGLQTASTTLATVGADFQVKNA